jgi:hypothetical protein
VVWRDLRSLLTENRDYEGVNKEHFPSELFWIVLGRWKAWLESTSALPPFTFERSGKACGTGAARRSVVEDFDSWRMREVVQFGMSLQPIVGRGFRDETDKDLEADQGLAATVPGDEAEKAVFDLVPFACTGRELAYGIRPLDFIAELPQFHLPKPCPRTAVVASGPAG